MDIIKSAFLLFLCGLATNNAHAFSPEVAHDPLSRLAFEAYSQCLNDTVTYPYNREAEEQKTATANNKDLSPPKLWERIVSGNRAMDEGPGNLLYEDMEHYSAEMLFSVGQRPFNWHFYNPDNNSPEHIRQGLVEKSQRRLWQRAKDGFAGIEGAYNKAIYLGAIMHLLEDMGVPAHVVPVYHGPKLPWWYGDFSPVTDYIKKDKRYTESGALFKDPLDDIAPDEERLRKRFAEVFKPSGEFCASVVKDHLSADEIRDVLARKTLESLKKPIQDCGNATWGVFWNNDIRQGKNQYFKGYNLSAPEFNEKGTVKINANGKPLCHMKKCDRRYSDFLFDLHLDVIKADVQLLYWAKQQMQRL